MPASAIGDREMPHTETESPKPKDLSSLYFSFGVAAMLIFLFSIDGIREFLSHIFDGYKGGVR